ncbi:NAD(P)-binding protein [Kroppenstedtia pulmonis]|uniref:NAD(P)-binding protein n=1 Tax=Kroppenstedtia pulmonis TaxID=1380685 RepID=A0A7D4CUX9_9BACL|nr:FAD-dependent monooxygenase [Kroppenstedtia pulmonis]QKG83777.1 NAD(P)-binding protein [Kroppenstedtia pulmonis]
MSSKKILIVGAGIGGLTTAGLLRKKGFEVEVFERRDQVLGEQGTALNIWSNAVKALDRLGLGNNVRSIGCPIERQTIYSWKGTLLMDTPVGEISGEYGAPSVNIRRSDLVTLLYDFCKDVSIQLGRRYVGYKEDAQGVTVQLDNGDEVRGDVLIGADGLRSRVRAQLVGDGDPDYLGYTIWRGISEGPGLNKKGNLAMYWGPRGINGGCWWVDNDHVSWTLGLNTQAGGKDEPGKVKEDLLQMIHDFPEAMKMAIKQTPEDKLFRIDGYARTKADKWGEGRVTLLGDAAHAMPTIYGQGACQAIEDAVLLAESLAEAPDVITGLRTYERSRQPRMNWIRSKIYFGTKIQTLTNPLLLFLKNFYVKWFFPKKANLKTWRRLLAFNDEGIQVTEYEK